MPPKKEKVYVRIETNISKEVFEKIKKMGIEERHTSISQTMEFVINNMYDFIKLSKIMKEMDKNNESN